VATRTGALHLCVIYTGHRSPHRRDMAGFAQGAGGDVCGVFAGCPQTIVTTGAITDDAGMTEARWPPRGRGMAAVAFLSGGNMPCRLACGTHAAVTGGVSVIPE
jgi:hypothetical protein